MMLSTNSLIDNYKYKSILRPNRPIPLDLNTIEVNPLFEILNSSGLKIRSSKIKDNTINDNNNKLKGDKDNEAIEDENNKYSKLKELPKVYIILQMMELFINIGLRSILTFYLKSYMDISFSNSKIITHLFGAIIYLSPIIMGIIADLFLFEYFTCLLCLIVLNLGLILLLIITIYNNIINSNIIYICLLFIAIGLGGLKPILNSMAYYNMKKDKILLKYYFNINFLFSTFSTLISCFLIPYSISFKCYTFNQCYPLSFFILLFISMVMLALFLIFGKREEDSKDYNDKYNCKYNLITPNQLKNANNNNIKKLINTFILISPLSFFWMLYDQSITSWQNQYENMDKQWINNIIIPTEMMASINILFLIIILLIIIFFIEPTLNKLNRKLDNMYKIIMSFSFLISAYLISNLLQYEIELNDSIIKPIKVYNLQGRITKCDRCVPGHYQLLQIFLQALAEAILGTSTPQLAYDEASPNLLNTFQGLLYLNNSIGNLIVYFMDQFVLDYLSIVDGMWCYIILAIIANTALCLLYKFKYKN